MNKTIIFEEIFKLNEFEEVCVIIGANFIKTGIGFNDFWGAKQNDIHNELDKIYIDSISPKSASLETELWFNQEEDRLTQKAWDRFNNNLDFS